MITPSIGRTVRASLAGGALAGGLDIAAAFLVYGMRGVRPIRILQSIASGLLGVVAFEGGMATGVLGLVLQFFIASVAAWVYHLGSLRAPVLVQRPVTCGALYGIAVYVVMNFVVVPLSAVPKRPFAWDLAPVIVIVHIVCVGIPIAYAVQRYGAPARP